MKQKQKILFLITKSNFGGAQRYVFDLATNLPTEKFDIVVALGGDGELVTKLEDADIRVVHIPGLQRDISLTKELRSFWSIAKLLYTEKPDILHVNSSKAGGIGAFWGRILRTKRVIYTAHGWAFNENRGVFGRFIVGFFHWLTILFSHTTITVSDTLRAQMKWPFTKQKMITVYNGSTTPSYLLQKEARAYFIEHEPRLRDHTDKLWTGTIGELHYVKGHDVAIAAMATLKAFGLQCCHLIIGAGEEHESLQQQIDTADLSDTVFLLGYHSNADRLLKAFDIYIQPSRSEALGYTVIEAVHAHLPIVASEVGGIPEILSSHAGLLVPPNDPDALMLALQTLSEDSKKRATLVAATKEHPDVFSLHTMLDATIALYEPPRT